MSAGVSGKHENLGKAVPLALLLPVVLIVGGVLAGEFAPARGSTFYDKELECPVGGETFRYMALGSISTWGALPDGMPLGSGQFPVELPQCPTNGLVMYRDFTPQEVERLKPFIEGEAYKALLAADETPRYLAYRTAQFLGDKDLHWLLLEASWEAKNDDPESERARRYNDAFVTEASKLTLDPEKFASIAARYRLANALRELGRFEQAEAVRAGIVVSQTAGGSDEDAERNRSGWRRRIAELAGPIARKEAWRVPIDMMSNEDAAGLCLAREIAAKFNEPPPPPLTAFEKGYCARPELAAAIRDRKKWLRETK